MKSFISRKNYFINAGKIRYSLINKKKWNSLLVKLSNKKCQQEMSNKSLLDWNEGILDSNAKPIEQMTLVNIGSSTKIRIKACIFEFLACISSFFPLLYNLKTKA